MTLSTNLVRGLVIGVVVGVVGLGLLFSRRVPPSNPSSSTSATSAGSISTTPTAAPTTSALPTDVAGPILNATSLYYYDESALALKRFDLTRKETTVLGSQVFSGAAPIVWSANGDRVAARLVASTPNWSSIDTRTNTIVTLDPGVFLPTLNPGGTKLAYQYVNKPQGTITVTVADAVGKNWMSILPVSRPYAALWYGSVETYLVALDNTGNPHYDRIGISSKQATKLADGNGDLKWSPSGQLALLDSLDGQSVTVAQLESSTLTKISGTTTVDRLTWESESTLVGFVGNDLVRIDLAKRTTTVLSKNVAADHERASVVGIFQSQLVLFDAGTISLLAVPES